MILKTQLWGALLSEKKREKTINSNWLVVSTPLKDISQIGSPSQLLGKIKKCSEPPTSQSCLRSIHSLTLAIVDKINPSSLGVTEELLLKVMLTWMRNLPCFPCFSQVFIFCGCVKLVFLSCVWMVLCCVIFYPDSQVSGIGDSERSRL